MLAVFTVFLTGCHLGFLGINLNDVYDERLGGDTTAFSDGKNAFELSARNLDTPTRRAFEVGDSFFEQNWVTAPASTKARDGLGPTLNALSCSSCHSHDGRARPPENADDPVRGLLLRLSIPGQMAPLTNTFTVTSFRTAPSWECPRKAVLGLNTGRYPGPIRMVQSSAFACLFTALRIRSSGPSTRK